MKLCKSTHEKMKLIFLIKLFKKIKYLQKSIRNIFLEIEKRTIPDEAATSKYTAKKGQFLTKQPHQNTQQKKDNS